MWRRTPTSTTNDSCIDKCWQQFLLSSTFVFNKHLKPLFFSKAKRKLNITKCSHSHFFLLYFGLRAIYIGIVLTIRMEFFFNFMRKKSSAKNKEKIHWRRKNESFERWKDWIFDITSRHLSFFFNGSKELLKIRETVCMGRNPFANTGRSIYFISLENHFPRILSPNKGFCLFFFV